MSRAEKLIVLLIAIGMIVLVLTRTAHAAPAPTCASTVDLTDRYARHVATYIGYRGPVHRHGCERTSDGIARRYSWRDPELGYVSGMMRVRLLRGQLHPYNERLLVKFNDSWYR